MRRRNVVVGAIAAALLTATGFAVAEDKNKLAEKPKELGAVPARVIHMQTAFNPALLCRPQTTAALQTRAAKRVSSGREP